MDECAADCCIKTNIHTLREWAYANEKAMGNSNHSIFHGFLFLL